MNEQLNTIGNYWTDRSTEFSKYMLEHRDEELSKFYYGQIKKHVSGKRIKALDIGCGPGIAAMMLADMGNDVTAIDWSDGMIEQVRKNSNVMGLNIDIQKMDAQNLSFDDNTFDLIVSSRLIWNLPDPVKAYSEWLRVLKPEGAMILYDGNYFYDNNGERSPVPTDDNEPQMYQGADFRIIRNVAKDLPLSSKLRPAWDVELLISLGVGSIDVAIEEYVNKEKDGMKIPSTFTLTIKKTVSDE